jgi:hypothetical protein
MGFNTQIIASSIRHPMHVVEAAKIGVMLYHTLFGDQELIQTSSYVIGIKNFLAIGRRFQKSLFK